MAQRTSQNFTKTDTSDGIAIVISELVKIGDLRPFFIQIQVSATDGTALLEVAGPGGLFITHTSGLKAKDNPIVILSAGRTETYQDARVTFTGTSNTNTLAVNITREPR